MALRILYGPLGKTFTICVEFSTTKRHIQGSQPNGGNVVIQVQLSRLGELESFELISSFGSSIQMEESVVNAILSVSQLPPLPILFKMRT